MITPTDPEHAIHAGQTRWTLDGPAAIAWDAAADPRLPHEDHVEMSGLRVSLIVHYGADANGALTLSRHVVWPALRMVPNDTHASLSADFDGLEYPEILVDGAVLPAPRLIRVRFDGTLALETDAGFGLEVTRRIFPTPSRPAAVEAIEIANRGPEERLVAVHPVHVVQRTLPELGVDGEYLVEVTGTGEGEVELAPGASRSLAVQYSARSPADELSSIEPSDELAQRERLVEKLGQELVLETPDSTLGTAFALAKLRATESIFATRGGLMHGPGGGRYYAAIWANDQAEYANPLFGYLGLAQARESALNSFRHFARYMNPNFDPLPSSIIAEGLDVWTGAGDRGDAAMVAYGAARFALAAGDRAMATELWPLVEWCLEYCRRRLTAHGGVASDSDELEGRFPAGTANLSTSSLHHDALLSAAMLARDLKAPTDRLADYQAQAARLRAAIEREFGALVNGFETYRYYAGNTSLRAWIGIPLTMGIDDRAKATTDALFSPRLWTNDGVATEADQPDIWDRSTLYALRAAFAVGDTERALRHLEAYSTRRLLGDHVPYPIEATTEGNHSHLAAESALYCRIYTEGLFGMRPTGLRSLAVTPRLPAGWERMALRSVHGHGAVFDLEVARAEDGIKLRVSANGRAEAWTLDSGEAADIRLPLEAAR